jgi:hypothetical protein
LSIWRRRNVMKKLMLLAAMLSMAVLAAVPALAQDALPKLEPPSSGPPDGETVPTLPSDPPPDPPSEHVQPPTPPTEDIVEDIVAEESADDAEESVVTDDPIEEPLPATPAMILSRSKKKRMTTWPSRKSARIP